MKYSRPLIYFFILAAALPIAAAVDEFVFKRCSASILAEVMKEKPDFGCAEFFFNRYQSLIGNLITAAVAGTAFFWAAGQLVAANRQAATATVSVLRVRAGELEQVLADITRLEETASQATAVLAELSYNRQMDIYQANRKAIAEIWDVFREQRTRLRASSRTHRAASWFPHLDVLLSGIDDIGLPIGHAYHATFARSPHNSITDAEIALFKRIQSAARERFPRFFPKSADTRAALEREIVLTWRQIRIFEDAAVESAPGSR